MKIAAWAAGLALAEPAFFVSVPYRDARSRAADNNKFLFVKATADWCSPCDRMDETTFKDQRVIEWLSGKAVSVSVDVDEHPAIAADLGIRAMPISILFRGDEEIARRVGYIDAVDLLTWLAQAEGDKIAPTAVRETPSAQDIQARMLNASRLTGARAYAKATDEYVWLWDHMLEHEPAMYGVRLSFMASDMRQLAVQSPDAKRRFAALRDATAHRLRTGPRSWEDLHDWITLNESVLGDRAPIIVWIERIKDRPTGPATFSRFAFRVKPLLLEEGRWDLYGSLLRDVDFADLVALQKLKLGKIT